MSKLVINIEQVVFQVPGVVSGHAATFTDKFAAELFGSIFPRSGDTSDREEQQPDPATGGTAAPAQDPEVTVTGIAEFLASDSRYSLRTFESIAKAFPASRRGELADVLDGMVADGGVERLTRRSDRAPLFRLLDRSLLPASASQSSAGEAHGSGIQVSADAVRRFLKSDSRYTWRTESAIFKHFIDLGAGRSEIDEALDDAVSDDLIESGNRDSDGATIYRAIED